MAEKMAWEALKFFVGDFPGNHRSPNYRQVVEIMLQSPCLLGA
jgi:hypothetical protein